MTMPCMTNFEFGTVVLVPFPFTNQLESKQRPAIVISSNDYCQHKNDIILIAVTSQIKNDLLFAELPIENWREAGLLKPSLIIYFR